MHGQARGRTIDIVELEDLYHRLKLAKKYGLEELDVNMDSLTAISYTKTEKPPWDVRNLVRKVKGYMDSLHILVIEHCYREGN